MPTGLSWNCLLTSLPSCDISRASTVERIYERRFFPEQIPHSLMGKIPIHLLGKIQEIARE
jgi:hypothetical protein